MSKTLATYQSLARLVAKHYVTAEGPGWGYIYRMFIGHAERDWTSDQVARLGNAVPPDAKTTV